jgi:ribose/xylose/arabinose/galactoside ABC-type transport system permease subunit
MGFWQTAAAAMVGGLGVLLFAALCRLAWFFFRMRYTAFGRHLVRIGTSANEMLKDMERRERGQ